MLYLVNIHWQRRSPQKGKPDSGHYTYPERARYLARAKSQAITKFHRRYGEHLKLVHVAEFNDPAGIFRR